MDELMNKYVRNRASHAIDIWIEATTSTTGQLIFYDIMDSNWDNNLDQYDADVHSIYENQHDWTMTDCVVRRELFPVDEHQRIVIIRRVAQLGITMSFVVNISKRIMKRLSGDSQSNETKK